MKRFFHAMLFAMTAFVVPSLLSAQAKPPAQPAAKPAAQTPAPPSTTKFVAPLRGEVELTITKPQSKREKDMVVTTLKAKNASTTGSVAGLRVQEYWYDKAGELVTGGDFRNRKPLMPGEVITITIETPFNAKMNTNQYTFTHANGKIKLKTVPKIE